MTWDNHYYGHIQPGQRNGIRIEWDRAAGHQHVGAWGESRCTVAGCSATWRPRPRYWLRRLFVLTLIVAAYLVVKAYL